VNRFVAAHVVSIAIAQTAEDKRGKNRETAKKQKSSM
jgi:hypothetical protein